MGKNILILGAGVSGLSTGILLLKKGFQVTIWAKDLPPNTTSNKAAAVWYPFSCGSLEKVPRWSAHTLGVFRKDILQHPESGCKKTTVVEVFDRKVPEPWWKDGVDTYKRISKEKLPHGYVDGYEIEGLVMDTDIYMQFLVNKFENLGGEIRQKEITDIKEAFLESSLVINCTGLGSRTLFNDSHVYPTRGQIVKVKPNGFDYSLFEQEGPNSLAYIIPRLNDIVLGGTAQKNDWNMKISQQDTKDILRKCAAIFPQFKQVEIIEEKVGLRPSRDTIRMEVEMFGRDAVIHNYGHGGAGFTLSWGCAEQVVQLVESLDTQQQIDISPVKEKEDLLS